jgi:hypothetical protein
MHIPVDYGCGGIDGTVPKNSLLTNFARKKLEDQR